MVPTSLGWIRVADDRRSDGEDARGAKPLDNSPSKKYHKRRGEGDHERPSGEDRHAGEIHPPPPDAVGERGRDGEPSEVGEHKRRERPRDGPFRQLERLTECREGGTDNGDVEGSEEGAKEEHAEQAWRCDC